MENRPNPVVWFEIYVNDIERATKFYEEVLQITLNVAPESNMNADFKMRIFPENNPNGYGAHGALVQMKDRVAGGHGTMVYFGSLNCEVEQKRVEDAGGKVMKPRFSIGEHGFISICEDTEGNAFGIYSMQ